MAGLLKIGNYNQFNYLKLENKNRTFGIKLVKNIIYKHRANLLEHIL